MSARLIHVGTDTCHRLMVLKRTGYCVEECNNLTDLRTVLESDPGPDAILFTEDRGPFFDEAFALVQAHPNFPLILFGDVQSSIAESRYDLVVPFLAPPGQWLAEVAALIIRDQASRIRARMSERDATRSRAPKRQAAS